MVHVSSSCNPAFHFTGAHYINADTTAVMQLIQGDLFRDFPTLRFVIPHGGGAVPYHWGRYRGLAQDMKKPLLKDHLLKNVYFDTCVYHQPGIDLLLKVIPADNILFASEMVGAVRGIDPETGQYYDDTRRYIDASALPAADKKKIFEGNVREGLPALQGSERPGLNTPALRSTHFLERLAVEEAAQVFDEQARDEPVALRMRPADVRQHDDSFGVQNGWPAAAAPAGTRPARRRRSSFPSPPRPGRRP
jgi:hypothetical protein